MAGPPPRRQGRRSSRGRRLAIFAVLAPLLILSLWQERPPAPDQAPMLRVEALAVPQPRDWPADLTLEGAWALSSPNWRFGSYSALIATADGRLIAYSDRGHILGIGDPGAGWTSARMVDVAPDPEYRAAHVDIESATYDPGSGTVWLGFEQLLGIRRFRPGAGHAETVEPDAMAGWPENGGPEVMARLHDGRFIVLAERDAVYSRDPGEGLLFPADPLEGGEPVRFRLVTGGGFQPTDMAALPDGRVLILLRTLALAWPPFSSRLVIADPADIRAGEPWLWQLLADIGPPHLRENYEGLAVAPRPEGGLTIWLISDDNATQMQRTLLLKLAWMP